MKKKLVLGLAAAMCLILFAGCSDAPANGGDTGTNSKHTKPAPAMENTILKDKTAWNENDNLFAVPLDALEGVSRSLVYRFENDLILTYSQFDTEKKENKYHVCLVSLESGEVLAEQQLLMSSDAVGQVLNDGIAVYDAATGAVCLLDESLEIVSEHQLDGRVLCLDPAGEFAYVQSEENGLVAVALDTMEETVIVSEARDAKSYDVNSQQAALSYVDTDSLMTVSGTLEFGGENTKTSAAANMADGVDVAMTEYPLCSGAFSMSEGAALRMNLDAEHIVIANLELEGIAPMAMYGYDGSFVSKCDGAGLTNATMSDLVWFEEYDGYLFTEMTQDGSSQLLFWDIAVPGEGEALAMEDTSSLQIAMPEDTVLSKDLYEQAAQISETYGVEILIGEQCMQEFVDHRADLLISEADVAFALHTIDHVLGSYPEGFFKQLLHDSYYQIEILVLGTLEKASSTVTEIYISGGFVTTAYPGKLVMALDARPGVPGEDINSILAQTMFHEFSHVIDKRLSFASAYREDALYTDEGWTALNPEGFEYNWSYYGTLDPQYADYFVDAYACTNETEDRARTMEYAIAGDTSTFAEKEGLIQKLEYYSQGIRDSFDTAGWPAETLWEETLNNVR